MLQKTMIVLATAAVLTAGLTAESFARGGGGLDLFPDNNGWPRCVTPRANQNL